MHGHVLCLIIACHPLDHPSCHRPPCACVYLGRRISPLLELILSRNPLPIGLSNTVWMPLAIDRGANRLFLILDIVVRGFRLHVNYTLLMYYIIIISLMIYPIIRFGIFNLINLEFCIYLLLLIKRVILGKY